MARRSMLELPSVDHVGSLIAYTDLYADAGEWSNLSQAVRLSDRDEDAQQIALQLAVVTPAG